MFTLLFALCLPIGGAPELHIDRSNLDLGPVVQGETVSAQISFSNTGSEVLEITEIKTSCGCTAANLDKTSYAPGERGQLNITLKTARLQGEITRKVTLYSNSAEGEHELLVKAQVAETTSASAD